MIRFLSIIAISISAMATAAAPRLVWLDPVYNFGAFREDIGTVTCRFKAVNTGDEPVVILSARPNCGCATPAYSRQPVPPGDTLVIDVAYNPTGRPGRFNKNVSVATNDPMSPHRLVVRGTVIASSSTLNSRFPVEARRARLSNDMVSFGRTRSGHMLSGAISIYNVTTDTIRPRAVDIPAYINHAFTPKAIPPGEQGVLSLTAYTDLAPELGIVTDSLRLIPDSIYSDSASTISLAMVIDEDFSKLSPEQLRKAPVPRLSDESVDFGQIPPGEKVSRSVTISNRGLSDMKIRRIYTTHPGVSVRASSLSVKPGKQATITVSVDPRLLPASPDSTLNARISIIVNAPSAPTLSVRAVGFISPNPQP